MYSIDISKERTNMCCATKTWPTTLNNIRSLLSRCVHYTMNSDVLHPVFVALIVQCYTNETKLSIWTPCIYMSLRFLMLIKHTVIDTKSTPDHHKHQTTTHEAMLNNYYDRSLRYRFFYFLYWSFYLLNISIRDQEKCRDLECMYP